MFTTTLPDSAFFSVVLLISSVIAAILRYSCHIVGIIRTRRKYNKTTSRAKWLLNELIKIRNRTNVEAIDIFIDFVELISRPDNHVKCLSDYENSLTSVEIQRLYRVCFALDIVDNPVINQNKPYEDFVPGYIHLGDIPGVYEFQSVNYWKCIKPTVGYYDDHPMVIEMRKTYKPMYPPNTYAYIGGQVETLMDLTLLKLNEALLA